MVLCEEDSTTNGGLLRIYVRDRIEQGVPGVKITVIWSGGTDTFFTGLKPEFDPGYADFHSSLGHLDMVFIYMGNDCHDADLLA